MTKTRINSVLAVVGTCTGLMLAAPADAVPIDTVYIFGDSFSDTGAGFALTDGGTAASYLAESFGSTVVLPTDPNPGTNSINFAQSGARVGVETPTGPDSLTTQVQDLVDLVKAGMASFDPMDTLFFLSGGLNDHERAPASEVTGAYTSQVEQLISLGAKYIEIALLPREVPAFTDSADFLNPAYAALVPELDAMYPRVNISLSNWGPYYDDILLNPGDYGITNVEDACVGFGPSAPPPCPNPEEHFYYFSAHPSDAAHSIVGEKLYQEALGIPVAPVPLPAALPMLGLGVLALTALRRRSRPAA